MTQQLATLTNPVNSDTYHGGDALNTHLLKEFCYRTSGNFHTLANELQALRLRQTELAQLNAKLIQFMNWLAVTNPQILDEFQNTSDVFDKLSPRDDAGQAKAFAATQVV